VEQNRKAGQNPPRVVAPTEEEEDICEPKSLPVGVGTGSQRCSSLQLRTWVLGEIRHH